MKAPARTGSGSGSAKSEACASGGSRKNADGSVEVSFGPKAPEGQALNGIPPVADKAYFRYFRFNGPQPPLFATTWKRPDLEPVP
jgi:hypothetical protein